MLITISRQYGAGGSEVARRVAEALDWRRGRQRAGRAGRRARRAASRKTSPSGRSGCRRFVERLARTLAAATPELFASPLPGGPFRPLQEADLVRITETVVAEIAEQGQGGAGGPGRACGARPANATRFT